MLPIFGDPSVARSVRLLLHFGCAEDLIPPRIEFLTNLATAQVSGHGTVFCAPVPRTLTPGAGLNRNCVRRIYSIDYLSDKCVQVICVGSILVYELLAFVIGFVKCSYHNEADVDHIHE